MNRLRHLMSLCIFISLMACEQNEDWVVNEPMQSFEENPEYAPLNTIPDWVSEKWHLKNTNYGEPWVQGMK